MMKRILSLVLALLTLATPVCALGEASLLDVTVTVDEDIAAGIYKGNGYFADSADADALCAGLAKLMNGYGFSLLTQEDAMRLTLRMAGKELTDLSVLWDGDALILTSSQMNGSGLSIPMDELDADVTDLLPDVDWSGLLLDMLAAAVPVLEEVEYTSARGSFSGDAFTGGVYCDTLIFDDALIARLLDALMTDGLRDELTGLANEAGLDAKALLDSFDQKNAEVLAANAHRYILRLVYDADDQIIGLSATVLQGESQLCTLSVGFGEKSLNIVAGFPVSNANYWHSHEIAFESVTDEDGTTEMNLKGDLIEFTADRTHAFPYALYNASDLRMTADWTLEATLKDESASYKLNAVMQMGENTAETQINATGLYLAGSRFHGTVAYALAGTEYLNMKVNWAPCDPIDATGAELTVCDLLSGDEALLNEIATEYGYALVLQMMQVIPMDLLMMLQ